MGESLTYPFEPQPPDWDFDELLDSPEDELARPQDTLLALKAVARAEAMLHARRLQLMQQLRLAKAGDADGEWTADLVAVELNISIPRAQRELGYAGFLAEQLPETLRLLGAGRLDAVRARRISELATGLTHEQKIELEQRIYPRAADLTPRRLTSLVKRQIIAIDPRAAQQQATAARAERRVSIEPAEHGMGWLNAYLPSEDLHAVYDRIGTIARRCKGADDERTMDQARADVMRDLILGKHGTGGGTVTTVYVTATAEPSSASATCPASSAATGRCPQSRSASWPTGSTPPGPACSSTTTAIPRNSPINAIGLPGSWPNTSGSGIRRARFLGAIDPRRNATSTTSFRIPKVKPQPITAHPAADDITDSKPTPAGPPENNPTARSPGQAHSANNSPTSPNRSGPQETTSRPSDCRRLSGAGGTAAQRSRC